VLVKLNVARDGLASVIELLPALRSPTVSELSGGGGYAVETVVPKSDINTSSGAEGPRRQRHLGTRTLQDRPLSSAVPVASSPNASAPQGRHLASGSISAYDADRGLGTLIDEAGQEWPFHCTAIAGAHAPSMRAPPWSSSWPPGTWASSRHGSWPRATQASGPGSDLRAVRRGRAVGVVSCTLDGVELDRRRGGPGRAHQRSWGSTSPRRGRGLDQGAERVDGHLGLVEDRGHLGQVDSGQLEEAVAVVGDDDAGRSGRQLATELFDLEAACSSLSAERASIGGPGCLVVDRVLAEVSTSCSCW